MKRGFTLIDLIAVIVILAIIALITTASVMGLFNKTKSSLYETQVEIVESAAKKWAIANNGFLPTDGSEYALQLSKLVTDGYLDDGDIVDPRTEKEMNGYVNIIYDNSINQYKIEFINLSNAGLTKEYVLNNVSLVTEGAGLYDDKNKTGRYYFRGKNPNNYIKFNNEIWRIISIESNGTLKIIKETGFNHVFDEIGSRSIENANSACAPYTMGCPIWAKNGTTILKNSELLTYLNGSYYDKLNKYKDKIVTGQWCYRHISTGGTSASDFLEDEFFDFCGTTVTNGKVGLVSIKEIKDASLGTCGYMKNCQNNYLNNGTEYWTLNYSYDALIMDSNGDIISMNASNTAVNARPVLYLKSDLELSGKGTGTNPFIIK